MRLRTRSVRFLGIAALAVVFAIATASVSAFQPGSSPFNATNSSPDCVDATHTLPAPGSSSVSYTCTPSGGTQAVTVAWVPDEVSGANDNSWVQGTSSDCYLAKAGASTAACVTAGFGSIPGKNDLQQLGVGLEKATADGDFYFYGGINRADAGGISSSNANYNIEIEQLLPAYKPASPICTKDYDGACNRWRSPGDLVIMVDWGGNTASCSTSTLTVNTPAACIYKWIVSGVNGDDSDCFNAKTAPCWGDATPLSIGGSFAAGSISANSRFSEIALNLSGAGIVQEGACETFSQVIASSRASSSFTAEEKDKIYGDVSLSTCTTTSTTLQQVNCDTSANIGDAAKELSLNLPADGSGVCVKDIATVGGGATSGNVNFRYYSSFDDCDADTDGTGGTNISTNGANSSGVATSDKVTFTSTGTIYFRAFYLGDGLSPSSSDCDEILTLKQDTSTSTTLHETNSSGVDVSPSNNGAAITVNTGAYVKDVATVTPSSATGTVTFKWYTTDDCSDAGTTAGTNVAVSGGSASSSVVQFNDPGTFYWRAFFTGSGDNNDSASACGDETVTVNKVDTAIATAPWIYPNDSATITTPNGGGNPTGSVKFRLYDTLANCSATTPSDTVNTGGLLYKETVNLPASSPFTANTSNQSVKVSSSTAVYWLVEFTSTNPAQNGGSSVCVENINVTLTGDSPAP